MTKTLHPQRSTVSLGDGTPRALVQLDFRVAELVKSFGRRGESESLDDFRYGPTLIFDRTKALESFFKTCWSGSHRTMTNWP